jgi:hypothetical protein
MRNWILSICQKGLTDASFTITLRHQSGAHSHVSASKLNHIDARELRAYATLGAYASSTTDVQAQDIFAGKRPAQDLTAWGCEPRRTGARFILRRVRPPSPLNRAAIMITMRPSKLPSGQARAHRSLPMRAPGHSLSLMLRAKARPNANQFASDHLGLEFHGRP